MLGSIPKTKNRQTFSSSCIAEAMWNLALTQFSQIHWLNGHRHWTTHTVPRRLEDRTKGSRWSMLSRAMSTQHYGPPLHTRFMLKACEHYFVALQWPVLKSRLITTVNWRSLQPANSLVGLDNHLQFLLSLEPTDEFLRQCDSDSCFPLPFGLPNCILWLFF